MKQTPHLISRNVDAIVSFLEKECVGFLKEEEFERLENRIRELSLKIYIDKQTENNFIRLFNSLLEKRFFLKLCVEHPHYLELVIGICSYSDYLTEVLSLNAEYFSLISDMNEFQKKVDEESFLNYLRGSLNNYKKLESKIKLLRLTKRRETLKIGARDILGIDTFEETIEQISILAKIILSVCFELSVEEVKKKYGVEGEWKYCLCSLGKLGGKELNYSSDVDLLLFYEKNYKITLADNSEKYFSELLTEVAQLFIKIVSENTEQGYLYRVDFRLRPEGKYSPICGGVWDYINYYETRGELWEKQMLLKLDFICGDKNLYDFFRKFVDSYIFNQSLFMSPFEQIAKMKFEIEKKIGDKQDVKLFSGGIRDIEFSVQALQLVYGKENVSLRAQNTLKAISALANSKKLSSREALFLMENYIFYRKIEHYLQLMSDIQTHEIPSNEEFIEKMAFYFKFQNAEDFWNALSISRSEIRNIFLTIVGNDGGDEDYSRINFKDLKKAERNFNYLKSGKNLFDEKTFDRNVIEAFEKIESKVVRILNKYDNPDSLLDSFARIVRSFSFPSQLYYYLSDDKALETFMRLCAFSQKGIFYLSTEKICQDFLTSGMAFWDFDRIKFESLNDRLLSFYLSFRFTNNIDDELECSKRLSEFVQAKMRNVFHNYNFGSVNCFIAGLGSFGAQEMTFGSDVDLFLIADDECEFEKAQEYASFLFSEIQKELGDIKLDMRLRPEGKNSPLIWTYSEAVKYLTKRARIWELQSLTKLRFIVGDYVLFNKFISAYLEEVSKRKKEDIAEEVVQMRKNLVANSLYEKKFDIKRDIGGLLDLQFAIQYLMLKNISLLEEFQGANLRRILIELSKRQNYIANIDLLKIAENYRFFKRVEFAFQNLYNKNEAVISLQKDKISELSQMFEIRGDEFYDLLIKKTEENRNFYKKIIEG